MEKEFGLSNDELKSRFYALAPRTGEESYAFVIRVEQTRRGVGASDEATLHSFVPKLSEEM